MDRLKLIIKKTGIFYVWIVLIYLASDSCQGISVLVFWKRLLVEEFSSFFLSVAVCACSDGRRRPLTHVSRFLFSVFVPPPPSSFFSCHQSVCKKKNQQNMMYI